MAVVGAGPGGLAFHHDGGLHGAARIIALDLDTNRLETAKAFGASDAVKSADEDPI